MITAAALTFPRLQACVTTLSGHSDAPVRQTVVTCSNTIQITIYNCRIKATVTVFGEDEVAAKRPRGQRRRLPNHGSDVV